ncbi:unnamed protein product [Linum trigynum]|uniref:Uncharacterized protein n=1 Tax=Linum trigynum TaxID=586398 RepID=A0AAV2DSE3_9ROSI
MGDDGTSAQWRATGRAATWWAATGLAGGGDWRARLATATGESTGDWRSSAEHRRRDFFSSARRWTRRQSSGGGTAEGQRGRAPAAGGVRRRKGWRGWKV